MHKQMAPLNLGFTIYGDIECKVYNCVIFPDWKWTRIDLIIPESVYARRPVAVLDSKQITVSAPRGTDMANLNYTHNASLHTGQTPCKRNDANVIADSWPFHSWSITLTGA